MPNLAWRASYFKAHDEAWHVFSQELKHAQGEAVAARPPDSSVSASLHRRWIAGFRELADFFEGPILTRGSTCTADLGDMLAAACHTYIQREGELAELSQTEINKILQDAGY